MTSDFEPNRHRSEPERGRAVDVHVPQWGAEGTVPAQLLLAWEAVYRDYVSASERTGPMTIRNRQELARLSAQVGVTWRRLAEAPGVAWWLVAAFSTAAEAMELQAGHLGLHGRRSR